MATHVALTQAWTQLGTGLAGCLVQFNLEGEVFLGAVAPAATDQGYNIKAGVPVELPAVADLGGGVWARSQNSGHLVYDIISA